MNKTCRSDRVAPVGCCEGGGIVRGLNFAYSLIAAYHYRKQIAGGNLPGTLHRRSYYCEAHGIELPDVFAIN